MILVRLSYHYEFDLVPTYCGLVFVYTSPVRILIPVRSYRYEFIPAAVTERHNLVPVRDLTYRYPTPPTPQGRIQRGATVAQAPVRFSKLKILIYAASALRDFCIFNRVFQGDAPAILIAQLDALDNKVQNNLIT